MLKVEEREAIRRAYYVEHKSIRAIARELHHSRETVQQAVDDATPKTYTLQRPRAAPILGPYKARIQELLAQNPALPQATVHQSSDLPPPACGGLSGRRIHGAGLRGAGAAGGAR